MSPSIHPKPGGHELPTNPFPKKITAKIISTEKKLILLLRVWGQMGPPLAGLKSDYVWRKV
jgi:hypothetical protein